MNVTIHTFAKLWIKRMDPALSACLVVPACAPLVDWGGVEMAIEHTRHRFGNMFPADLGTTYGGGYHRMRVR